LWTLFARLAGHLAAWSSWLLGTRGTLTLQRASRATLSIRPLWAAGTTRTAGTSRTAGTTGPATATTTTATTWRPTGGITGRGAWCSAWCSVTGSTDVLNIWTWTLAPWPAARRESASVATGAATETCVGTTGPTTTRTATAVTTGTAATGTATTATRTATATTRTTTTWPAATTPTRTSTPGRRRFTPAILFDRVHGEATAQRIFFGLVAAGAGLAAHRPLAITTWRTALATATAPATPVGRRFAVVDDEGDVPDLGGRGRRTFGLNDAHLAHAVEASADDLERGDEVTGALLVDLELGHESGDHGGVWIFGRDGGGGLSRSVTCFSSVAFGGLTFGGLAIGGVALGGLGVSAFCSLGLAGLRLAGLACGLGLRCLGGLLDRRRLGSSSFRLGGLRRRRGVLGTGDDRSRAPQQETTELGDRNHGARLP
jgi:hypothetical protein